LVGFDPSVTFYGDNKEEVSNVSGNVEYGDLKFVVDISNLDSAGSTERLEDLFEIR
jgi:hypothetical protein